MNIGCEKDGKKLNFFKISHFSNEIFSDDIKVMSLHELRQTLQYYLTELLFKKWQLLSC